MKFDLSNDLDLLKFHKRVEYLKDRKSKVDLTEVRKTRSISQNSYLHVCITLYAIEFGSTLNEAKTDLKRECEFMRYEKGGNHYLKETSKMDTLELTKFIEWIRNYSSMNGCYIPTSEEYIQNKFHIDKEIELNKPYL